MISPRQRRSHRRQAFLFPPAASYGLKNLPHRCQRRPKGRHRKKLLTQPCSIEKLEPCSREIPFQKWKLFSKRLLRRGKKTPDIPGIPLASSIKNSKPGVIFALEEASLVPAYVGRLLFIQTYEILNPDKHADFMRKKNVNPYDFRPDIILSFTINIKAIHSCCSVESYYELTIGFGILQVLADILGRRLNIAGMVKAVYVKTDQGLLIRIEPRINIPPTLGKFCSRMCKSSF